jgi:hypothetical protein
MISLMKIDRFFALCIFVISINAQSQNPGPITAQTPALNSVVTESCTLRLLDSENRLNSAAASTNSDCVRIQAARFRKLLNLRNEVWKKQFAEFAEAYRGKKNPLESVWTEGTEPPMNRVVFPSVKAAECVTLAQEILPFLERANSEGNKIAGLKPEYATAAHAAWRTL